MCGIAGIVSLGAQSVDESDIDALGKMAASLSTRGPDGSGTLIRDSIAFAHHRLAVRDIENGKQPWSANQCALVYNGEIYNDDELRHQLANDYQFKTNCDTEVVLASYLRWGRDCLKRLRGMFAFALYDFRSRTFWMVRDRFGVKPLYYCRLGEQLVFASQPSAILQHPKISKRPNWAVLSHYVSTTRWTLGNQSIYEGIEQLGPAEELVSREGRTGRSRYWDYPNDRTNISFDEAVVHLDDQLDKSIQQRLTSDIPVGMFLSGGVDSSTIAAIASRHSGKPKYATCASMDTGSTDESSDNNELGFASACAKKFSVDLEPTHIDSKQYLQRWHELIEDYRLPLSTPSDVAIYDISTTAKQRVGVVLGGEGADELLCGYEVAHWSGHDYDAATKKVRPQLLQSIERQYGRASFENEADHYFALNSLIPRNAKASLFEESIWRDAKRDEPMLQYYQHMFDSYGDRSTPEKVAVVLHRTNLEALLARLDAATMHAGLEARVPFTDHQLVESVFRLPFNYRISLANQAASMVHASAELSSKGLLHSKRLLRALARRIMPTSLANRRKASFPTGVARWIVGEWAPWISQYIRMSRFGRAIFREDVLSDLIRNPAVAGMWLWPIVNVCIWGDQEFF